ncbi:hypothetical protein ACHFCA_26405 [Delftia tsuruhatensis]
MLPAQTSTASSCLACVKGSAQSGLVPHSIDVHGMSGAASNDRSRIDDQGASLPPPLIYEKHTKKGRRMIVPTMKRAIQALEEKGFYDIAVLFLTALGYKGLSVVDGTGDGGATSPVRSQTCEFS